MHRHYYRRRRSRSLRPSGSYTVTYLLSHQPKSLRKFRAFPEMMDLYRRSPRLQTTSFNRRCYSLLRRATVREENVAQFCRTYRLPEERFFLLYFRIKREYAEAIERAHQARRQFILGQMRQLPAETLGLLKYLGHLERFYHHAGQSPLWQRRLFPTSKREAERLLRCTQQQWSAKFEEHLSALAERYPGFSRRARDIVAACIALGIDSPGIPPERPSDSTVSRAYRRLSLKHHPDRGGDAETFIAIKRARDLLAD